MAEIEMFLSLFSLIVGGKLLLCRAKVRLSHTQPPPPPPSDRRIRSSTDNRSLRIDVVDMDAQKTRTDRRRIIYRRRAILPQWQSTRRLISPRAVSEFFFAILSLPFLRDVKKAR